MSYEPLLRCSTNCCSVLLYYGTVFIYHGNASDVAEEAALQQDEDASCLNDMRTIVQLDE
jgi:hypothetical protein